MPSDSVLLYVDDKGPVTAAKTYSGTSWSFSLLVKVEQAQKINGMLNVFEGAYDYTNDKMHIQCYKRRQQNSLLIF